MASGDLLLFLEADSSKPPASGHATADYRNSIPVRDFDAAGTEGVFWVARMPPTYAGGGLTAKIAFMASTATSGNVVWGLDYERGTTDLDADSFATQNTVTVACSGTSGIIAEGSIAHTSGAQMDSIVVGDPIRIRLQRLGANGSDTMAGDAEMVSVAILET